MELVPYQDTNSYFRGHVHEKPNLTKVKTPHPTTFKASFAGVGNDHGPQNLVLRVVAPQKRGNQKYESLSLPVRFVPRMSLQETECVGYATVIMLVGLLFWVMLLVSARAFLKPSANDWVDFILSLFRKLLTWNIHKNSVRLNLLWSLLPTGACYLLMYKWLPDFTSWKSICVIAFSFTLGIGFLHLRNLDSPH